ncbi:MAG: type II toxin-antitoxin system VapC family toxin [Planctomycetota bacterium]
MLDTNVYISWIREKKYSELMLDIHTQKYISCYVLMELWAGARTKQGSRIIQNLQKPYINADRVVELSGGSFIKAGQILSDLPDKYKSRKKNAGFINDIFIGISALSIGAMLHTTNKSDFEIISPYIPGLRLTYL